MSTREQLNSYIGQLERRLRLSLLLRGAAILVGATLLTTVVLVLIINSFAFSSRSVISARAFLFFAIVLVVSFFLAIPLSRLTRRSVVGKAENVFPQFKQSLVTFAERDADGREPFIELLAADTLKKAQGAEPAVMVPRQQIVRVSGRGCCITRRAAVDDSRRPGLPRLRRFAALGRLACGCDAVSMTFR